MAQSILYACVCLGTQVKAEAGTVPSKVTLKAFIDGTVSGPFANKEKASFNHDVCSYNYIKTPAATFIAVAPKEIETRVVYDFLEQAVRDYGAGGDRESIQQRLNVLMARFQPRTTLEKAHEDIAKTKEIMSSNIDNMMKRGAELEVLDEHVEDMAVKTVEMKEKATKVKKCAKWKRLRMRIIICVVLIIIIFIVLVAVCGGFSFPKCGGSGGSSTNVNVNLPPLPPPPVAAPVAPPA